MVELRPRRAKATAPAEASKVEETPKSKPKTPNASKRKATEDVSPITNKKAKSVKTPAKHKDTEVEAEPTPNTKKAKTPVKVKETSPKEVEETSAPKSSKKNKTPAKPKDTEKTLVQQTTTVDEPEKTPASKAKKNKTPAKSKVHETVITQEIEKTPASKAKTEKNLAKSKATEEDAPTETDKTPGTKSNKDKTPAKAKLAKDTPSKAAEQSTSKITENTPGKSKDQAKPGPQSTKKTPKSAKKSEPVEKTTIKDVQDEKAPKEDELVSSDEELDEQTKALIKTVDVEDVDGAQSGVVLFEEGQDVGKIPELSKKQRKKAQKELAGRSSKVKEDTGVIYIGRLPHGFYEHEMRSYFSQFGPIRNLRVARNKQTGKPKHFAFIEFEEASTAAIVAKTMDNYLLFGHILKCSVIPKAQIHDELFKGANKRFKPVPWNKMEGKQMQRPMIEDKWSRKITKENKRRADRAKNLEALGYVFSAPEVKGVGVAKSIAAHETEEQVEQPAPKAIEAPPAAEAAAAAEDADEATAAAATPKPAKRGRGRPPKTTATETMTPNKRAKRTKA